MEPGLGTAFRRSGLWRAWAKRMQLGTQMRGERVILQDCLLPEFMDFERLGKTILVVNRSLDFF